MKILNKRQYDALTEKDRKAYDEALAAYVAKFQEEHPDGLEITARIKSLAVKPYVGKDDKKYCSMELDFADTILEEQIPEGRINRPKSNADIIASNANFQNWQHFALTLASKAMKGSFKFTVSLRVKGDEYTVGTTTRKYLHTHLVQENFVYVPSTAVSAAVEKATNKVIEAGFMNMMSDDNDGVKPRVSDAVPAGEQDDVEV